MRLFAKDFDCQNTVCVSHTLYLMARRPNKFENVLGVSPCWPFKILMWKITNISVKSIFDCQCMYLVSLVSTINNHVMHSVLPKTFCKTFAYITITSGYKFNILSNKLNKQKKVEQLLFSYEQRFFPLGLHHKVWMKLIKCCMTIIIEI